MPTVFLLKTDGSAGKSMGKHTLVPVPASKQLELSVLPVTSVPKICRKTSRNSKFASVLRNAGRTEEAQRRVRLNLLFE